MGEKKKNIVCTALVELKNQQDQLEGCPSSCFSSLLAKLLKVDTLPFILLTEKNEPLELVGFEYKPLPVGVSYFHTSFFRIEKINEDTCTAKVSLLRPLDENGFTANDICEVNSLERTKICVEIDLNNTVCGVQCLDVDLLRKVEIEPKW
ncbi:hypothetical protein FZW96_15050 [Bacillus sp. BGMRC 2118]|nr:hypothetical protein FZW96_15050 [Bacillus sp. BGMRC 2118]